MCSCGDIALKGDSFKMDSFDSRQGPYDRATAGGAALAPRGRRTPPANDAMFRGSVFIGGGAALSITGQSFVVAGDLKTNAAIQADGPGVFFRRDVWTDADVQSRSNAAAVVGRD